MSVRVQVEDFDVAREIAQLRAGNAKVGAVAAFIGIVRDLNDAADVRTLTLEHYPGMTEKALAGIVTEAETALGNLRRARRAPGRQARTHRPDRARRGGQRASRRRVRSLRFIMDYLKTRAPFWKKEETPGGERWVEARASDDDAAARW